MKDKIILRGGKGEKPWKTYTRKLANKPMSIPTINGTIGFLTNFVRTYLSIIFAIAQAKAAKIENNIHNMYESLLYFM